MASRTRHPCDDPERNDLGEGNRLLCSIMSKARELQKYAELLSDLASDIKDAAYEETRLAEKVVECKRVLEEMRKDSNQQEAIMVRRIGAEEEVLRTRIAMVDALKQDLEGSRIEFVEVHRNMREELRQLCAAGERYLDLADEEDRRTTEE